MNYEELTDRELDALVADRILGLQVLPEWEHCWSAETDLDVVGESKDMRSEPHPVYVHPSYLDDTVSDTKIQGYPRVAVNAVPRFSAFVGDAFEVVEAMRERGYSVQLHGDHLRPKSNWVAEFTSMNDSWGHMGKSLPRAICLAALRACDE